MVKFWGLLDSPRRIFKFSVENLKGRLSSIAKLQLKNEETPQAASGKKEKSYFWKLWHKRVFFYF